MKQKKCKECKKEFNLNNIRHPNQMFCSKRCNLTNWYKNNKDYNEGYKKEWRNNNIEHVRAKGRTTMKKYRKDCRLTVLKYYSQGEMECACCKENHYEFLCIDHINGGGRKERQIPGRKGADFFRWLINQGFPEGYRVLCHNCNMAMGFYKKCPHNNLK